VVIRLGVDCNRILRFAIFVDLYGYATIFGHQVFRFFHVVNPIKRRVVRS
jgi:hypothetical protein